MLLALALSVLNNPFSAINQTTVVNVRHKGPPVEVSIIYRTRETSEDQWEYLESKYQFPRKVFTTETGTRVVVRDPKDLKSQNQICTRYTPPESKDPKSGATSFSFVVESCANLPKAEPRRKLSSPIT